MQTSRNPSLDVVKAVAILAVVLYHAGACPRGFLGVDVFLVLAGFFTAKASLRLINGGGGKYLIDRAFRLLPTLLLAGTMCLVYGYFLMMPDPYENEAQEVVATNLFANNLLQSITTRNYWDVGNDYKPLMHTWYVGLLMQWYVAAVLLTLVARTRRSLRRAYIIIGVASAAAYLFWPDAAMRFYHLPTRLYEFAAGSLLCLVPQRERRMPRGLFAAAAVVGTALLLVPAGPAQGLWMPPAAVALTLVVVYGAAMGGCRTRLTWLAPLGAASYSLFVWHQVVFALTRYSFTAQLAAPTTLAAMVVIIAALTFWGYRYVESLRPTRAAWTAVAAALVLTTALSLGVYMRAGVVRDVPELGVCTRAIHRGMWAEYCDRGYRLDHPFRQDGRPRILVVGNSFARDFVNIIRESPLADSVDLSYTTDVDAPARPDRFRQADRVFLAVLGIDEAKVGKIRPLTHGQPLYIVGDKNFGESNGQVFRRRHRPDYRAATILPEAGYAERNARLQALYPTRFVDMMGPVSRPGGRVRVFTPEGRFISQDCRHLTQAGAQYYARLLPLRRLLLGKEQ